MKRSLSLWQFFGFAFASLAGTLLHFLYDLSGKALWAAPFSGVNESTWEHMKLLYVPLLLFSVIQRPFFKEYENFWCVKLYSTLAGLLAIPTLFYTLNGVFGKTPDYINIAIFFVSCALVFLLETRLFRAQIPCKRAGLSLWMLLGIGVLFVWFTFVTPRIPLFEDPLTGGYGIG